MVWGVEVSVGEERAGFPDVSTFQKSGRLERHLYRF